MTLFGFPIHESDDFPEIGPDDIKFGNLDTYIVPLDIYQHALHVARTSTPEDIATSQSRIGSDVLVQRLLRQHPLPWSVGECHETMATVYDAKLKLVFRVEGNMPWDYMPEAIVLLVAALRETMTR